MTAEMDAIAAAADETVLPRLAPPEVEGLEQVAVKRVSLGLLARALAPDRVEHLRAVAERAVPLLAGRVVWNINSTAKGGGVAEMLQTLLAYGRGAGVDTRWLVLRGEEEFFAITKRLHNRLHGAAGDGGPLGQHEHDEYAKVQQANLELMKQIIRPQDIVLLHDPQTAGLVDGLRELGATVIWRCHIGCDEQNQWSEHALAFLKTYAENAGAFIFSREAYAPQWVHRDTLWVIPPSIDPFSAKNREMAPEEVSGVLVRTGIIVVQKSLVEGFGLTVTEAMWKSRPMIASAVGGIQDQIVDRRDGLLITDPTDLDVFAGALVTLLDSPDLAAPSRVPRR